MSAYLDWLSQQTPERQDLSLELMTLSEKLGVAQRDAPHSHECEDLSRQVDNLYKRIEAAKP